MKYPAVALALTLVTTPASGAEMLTNTVGCASRDDLERALKFGRQGDREAYANFLVPRVQDGSCALFEVGDEVFVEDVALWAGLVCVRKRSDTQCHYLEIESVSD